MILTIELDLDNLKTNQRASYLCQGHLIGHSDRQTDTRWTDRSMQAQKLLVVIANTASLTSLYSGGKRSGEARGFGVGVEMGRV